MLKEIHRKCYIIEAWKGVQLVGTKERFLPKKESFEVVLEG